MAPSNSSSDFLTHLEIYLSKRDGVDKLLKISRYASKIILTSSILPSDHPLSPRLKSFESSVGLSRKAFRLGKFIQDVNALRGTSATGTEYPLTLIAYASEGCYYFIDQFIWLAKSGLIDARHAPILQKLSAWANFVGYIGRVSLKIKELNRITEDEACLESSIGVSIIRGVKCVEEEKLLKKLREKKSLKRLSIVQDIADGLMALADIRNGKGRLADPLLLSLAGLLSAIISTHKNWISC